MGRVESEVQVRSRYRSSSDTRVHETRPTLCLGIPELDDSHKPSQHIPLQEDMIKSSLPSDPPRQMLDDRWPGAVVRLNCLARLDRSSPLGSSRSPTRAFPLLLLLLLLLSRHGSLLTCHQWSAWPSPAIARRHLPLFLLEPHISVRLAASPFPPRTALLVATRPLVLRKFSLIPKPSMHLPCPPS